MAAAVALLQELELLRQNGQSQNNVLVEVSANHNILCNEKLFVPHIDKNKPITWTFTVKSSSRVSRWCKLRRVFTLDPYLPEYSIAQVKSSETLWIKLPQGSQEWEVDTGPRLATYQITIQFESADYGSFQQRLVFDFAERPLVFRQLEVVVAPEQSLLHTIQHPVVCDEDSELSWLAKYPMIPFDPQNLREQRRSEFPLPPNLGTALEFGHFDHLDENLTPEQYRQRLHMLLHIEEFERRRQMTRLTIYCSDLLYCLQPCDRDPSQLTIVLPVEEDLMDDASLLISRGGYALVRIQPQGSPNPVLYEVVVESLRKNRVLLRASSDLRQVLKTRKPVPASVCFRFVDTHQHMHWAAERVSLDTVFPTVPEGNTEQWSIASKNHRLNSCQSYALKQMLLPCAGPPLLILGPFGTGKTRTIAEAMKQLITVQLSNLSVDYRILLCTHSNSAADHYIKNYLHPFLTRSQIPHSRFKPLRVCWENRFVSTVSDEVLQYCLLDLHTGKFAVPTVEALRGHRVVVTTLVTASSIAQLDLPAGFFTHVFIDEAAQAMEAETIIPLCLAGRNTQIVLAGDHRQLSPPVMSTISRQLGLGRPLLVRLFEMYPAMSKWKVQLLQNYRAYDDIVEVPSHLFYQDTLIATLKRPPSLHYSVVFYGVHGQEEIADEPPSFLNRGEAAEVADRVEELLSNWPSQVWGEATPSRICVLAPYPPQVREIRRLLRTKFLGEVQVEGVNNVQGLEFDILFISTVRTNKVHVASEKNMGFLSDCKLLNTAITRARYRLVVVGDPIALCSIGECRVCWKSILSKCNMNGTFHYRLPFETLAKMIKEAKNSATRNRMLNGVSTGSISVPHCNNIVNVLPAPQASVLPQQLPDHFPGFSAHFPSTRPVFISSPGPVVIPRRPVPLPVYPFPAITNPFQQPSLINGPTPIGPVPQGMGFPCPVTPWSTHQQIAQNTTPVRSPSLTGHQMVKNSALGSPLPAEQQIRHNTGSVETPSTDQPTLPTTTLVRQLPPNDASVRTLANHQQQFSNTPSTSKKESQTVVTAFLGTAALVPSHLSYASLRESEGSRQNEPKSQQSRSSQHPIVPNESQRELLLLLESNLQNRQEMVLRERDLLARLQISFGSPVNQSLQENLEEQKSITEKEVDLIKRHAELHTAFTSQLRIEDGQSDDSREIQSSCTDPSSSTEILMEEDNGDSDVEEWFSAQQRDPIVQDYIKAFEKLTSRADINDEERFAHPDTTEISRQPGFSPLVAESSLATPINSEEVSPLQGWFLQPSEATVYIESYSINEEHLGKEEAQSKLATGELVACHLQIDVFSDGNTATAKVCDPNSYDIHIGSRTDINRAFNGDKVAVEVIGTNKKDSGIPQGKVKAILKENHPRKVVCKIDSFDKNMMTPIDRSNSKFVILQSKDHRGHTGVAVFVMKDGRIQFKSFVTKTEGKLFLVQLMKWGASYRYPLGFVVHYFQEGGDPLKAISILLAEHGVHKQHPKKIQNEAKKNFSSKWKIPMSERVKRIKFPEVFSVDCASCVEVDDALSVCWEHDGTYKVGVHIADVSFFVAKNSTLDKAAMFHGASVYGGTEVVFHSPMLPSRVGLLCSLLPNEERLALSVVFHLNGDGLEVGAPEIYRSIVTSCCKLTYDQCQDVIDGKKLDVVAESIQKGIGILGQLSFKMWTTRVRQGYASFDVDVGKSGAWSSSKMVEEFMYHTNRTVAERLLQSSLAKKIVPLRRQLSPKTHFLLDLYESCIEKGMQPDQFFTLGFLTRCSNDESVSGFDDSISIDLKTWEKISAALDEKDIAKVTVSILQHDNASGVGKILAQLTSIQERSEYVASSNLSTEMQSHFGLNVASYTHFTSPIRRYVDVVVHRILLAVLDGVEMPYNEEQVQKICDHCQIMSARIDAFQKQLAAVSRADALRKDSKWRMAKVESISPENLVLGGDEVDHIGFFYRSVNVHDCKPSSREWLEEEEELVLSWNVLEINATGQAIGGDSGRADDLCAVPSSSLELEPSASVTRQFLKIPQEFWTKFLQGLRSEDFHEMNTQRQMIDTNAVVSFDDTSPGTYGNFSPEESIATGSLAPLQVISAHTKFYRKRDTIPISLGAEMNRGLLRPSIMAVKFSDTIVCCMRHRRHPSKSFGVSTLTATKATYADVEDYQSVMLPLLECEAATASVNSDASIQIILHNVSVQWSASTGQFTLPTTLCVCHGLQLCPGDFLCLRSAVSPGIFHCRVAEVDRDQERELIRVSLVDCPEGFSVDQLNDGPCLYSLEVIAQGQAFRRMITAVKTLGDATELVRRIFLQRDIPSYLANNPRFKGQRQEETKSHITLNPGQEEAVKLALTSPLTLIQGPPGTGKTMTGVEVACQFVALNRREGTGGQVLFCAPSNHAVDVAARMLQTVPDVKVLRVYGRTIEDQTFKQSLRTTLWTSQSVMDTTCRDISLHFLVRDPSNPYSSRIAAAEEAIRRLKKKPTSQSSTSGIDQERDRGELCRLIDDLRGAMDEAEKYEISQSGTEVILCTCIEAGAKRVKRCARVSHVVIDEASMCLEAETLVALTSAGQRLKQVVLLGDHRQLGAVITCSAPRRLGLGKSLFEVLFDKSVAGKAYSCSMLQTQYRMHPSIREFPSQHFYDGLLKDARQLTSPDHLAIGDLPGFWAGGAEVRVVFCHVTGREESPKDYTGPEGREESKHNPQEVQAVIRVVRYLISHGLQSSQISVLTPYSAQRAKISRALQTQLNSCASEVLSVFASQGAERDFIVLSTVRSMSVEQIVSSTDNQHWLASHLGFLIDERQMNVALTRAKHGLIVIGNRHLLAVHRMWNSLISHCERLGSMVDETWLDNVTPT